MFHQPTPTATTPPTFESLDDPAQLRALCKNFLLEGVELSNRILDETKHPTRFNADAATRAYARVARAMHRTILLLNRLDNPKRQSPNRKPTPKDREPPESRDTPDRNEPFENDRGPEIGNRPTPEIVAAIQRDLDHVQKSHPTPTHPVARKSEAPSATAAPPPEPPPEPESSTAPSPASAGFGRDADEGRGEGAPQKPQPPSPPKHPPDG